MATHEDPSVQRVAARYLAAQSRSVRTAGEVRFIKDRGGDDKQWGWGTPGPSNREINDEFQFDPVNLKPLAKVLQSSVAAMGHALSAYHAFTRIKSSTVSPDGNLGGKGYIQKIPEMRRSYMNVVEALSSLTDTIHDEMQAPHWTDDESDDHSLRERDQVKEIMSENDPLFEDPEGWAKGEESKMPGAKELGGDDAGGDEDEGSMDDSAGDDSAGASKLASGSLQLWRWAMPAGMWRQERSVTPETADQWLAVFQKHEPSVAFVVSANKPRQPALWLGRKDGIESYGPPQGKTADQACLVRLAVAFEGRVKGEVF